MKWTVALLCAGCIAVLLAVFAVGTASAAVVPFNGIESSWLHHANSGEPVADWIKRINDVVAVRNGDVMQFQNRWYNSYSGSTDIRISYGGEHAGICAGIDEYVSYGLNYGNYYPSSSESIPYYSKVQACNTTPLTMLVSHQYVYNGIYYGTINPDNDYTMLFLWRAASGSDVPFTPTIQPVVTATPSQSATVTAGPSSNATLVPLPPAPAPGFDIGQLALMAAILAIVYAGYCITMKR